MERSPIYLQRLETATQEGLKQGLQQGVQQGLQQGVQQGLQQGAKHTKRIVIENLLRVRFGSLDDELSAIIEPLVELPVEEFTPLLVQLSREELLARFLD
jgi:flagellar biosynthesis/type III secretory pathway protein FliH